MTEKTPDKTPKKPICLIHDEWLEDPKFKDWLTKTDKLTGNCKVCRKNIKLGTMGVGAIRSHMTRSTVHKERMKLFCQALSDEAEAEAAGHLNGEVLVVENTNSLTTTNIQSPDNNDKQCRIIDDNVRTAELLYALNMVYNCASFNSLNDCGSLFKKMFPDSKIASSITLARTKATYIVKFGVAPFVKEKLVADLSLVDKVVIMFDESLNK